MRGRIWLLLLFFSVLWILSVLNLCGIGLDQRQLGLEKDLFCPIGSGGLGDVRRHSDLPARPGGSQLVEIKGSALAGACRSTILLPYVSDPFVLKWIGRERGVELERVVPRIE